MPPPPGGFYFPDDAFFFAKGTGIISNQEENHTIVEYRFPLRQASLAVRPSGETGECSWVSRTNLTTHTSCVSGVVTVADALKRSDPVHFAGRQ